MPYKDKVKQRDYQRQWVRQKRAKGSTMAVGSTTCLSSAELAEAVFYPAQPEAPFAGPLTKERQTSRKGFNE